MVVVVSTFLACIRPKTKKTGTPTSKVKFTVRFKSAADGLVSACSGVPSFSTCHAGRLRLRGRGGGGGVQGDGRGAGRCT